MSFLPSFFEVFLPPSLCSYFYNDVIINRLQDSLDGDNIQIFILNNNRKKLPFIHEHSLQKMDRHLKPRIASLLKTKITLVLKMFECGKEILRKSLKIKYFQCHWFLYFFLLNWWYLRDKGSNSFWLIDFLLFLQSYYLFW